jgi:uncharacterized protein YdiU (UPF0061 family)
MVKNTLYRTYNFDFEKIMSHCNSIQPINEQIDYLRYVLKEYKNRHELDKPFESYLQIEKKLKNEIKYRSDELRNEVNPSFIQRKHTEQRADKKIRWNGTETQIVYLFDVLYHEDFLEGSQFDERYSLISKHFENKEGKPFKNKQLAQTSQNLFLNKKEGKAKPKRSQDLEKIIEDTKKQD